MEDTGVHSKYGDSKAEDTAVNNQGESSKSCKIKEKTSTIKKENCYFVKRKRKISDSDSYEQLNSDTADNTENKELETDLKHKKRKAKEIEKDRSSTSSTILNSQKQESMTPLLKQFFDCIYLNKVDCILDQKFVKLLLEGLGLKNLEKCLDLIILDEVNLSELFSSDALLKRYLADLSLYFDFRLETEFIKEDCNLNELQMEEQQKKAYKPKNIDSQIKQSNAKSDALNTNSSKSSLYENKINSNDDTSLNEKLIKKFVSFSNFLSTSFENWIKSILIIILKSNSSFHGKIKTFNKYIREMRIKGNKMLKSQRYLSCGPFCSPNSIKLKLCIKDLGKRSDFNKKARSLIREYIIEAVKILGEIEHVIDEINNNQSDVEDISEQEEYIDKPEEDNTNIALCNLIRKIEKRIRNSTDGRKREVFDENKKYSFESMTCLEYIAPDLKSTRLIIPKKCQEDIEKDLNSLHINIKSRSRANIFKIRRGCSEKDDEKLRPMPFNFQRITNNKEVMSTIKKLNKNENVLYQEEISRQLNFLSKKYLESLKVWKENNSEYVVNSKSIKDYDWLDSDKRSEQITSFIENKANQPVVYLKDIVFDEPSNQKACINQLAEIVFGSCPPILETELENKIESEKMKKLISRRTESILYLLKNSILPYSITSDFSNDLLCFIIHEMVDNEENKIKEGIIGEQYETFLNTETIIAYPFESLMKCNSTKGKLFLIENWEKFCILDNFGNQTMYRHIFGFTHSDIKGVHYNINTNIDEISNATRETKIHFIKTIRNKIQSLVRELKPILMFRFIVEKDLNRFQGSMLRCKTDINYSELIFYQLVLCYMYLLNHLMRFEFDIDKCMRSKLTCKFHSKQKHGKIPNFPCLCVYLMDTKSVLSSMQDFSYREKETIKYKSMYFSEDERAKCFKIKDNLKQELASNFKRMIQDHKMISSIEKTLKVDLDWLKL